MKTEVYSWRVSRDLKSHLEREARHRKVPVSSLLEEAVRKWLKESAESLADDDSQRKLHAAAEAYLGVLSSGTPGNAESVRKTIRRRLARRYAR
jgi:post-segregation antitoxin (ccd killing protein)